MTTPQAPSLTTRPNDFEGREVVVTGGAGALGRAVVSQLLARGARVHVPCLHASERDAAPWRDDPSVRAVAGVDLGDEAQVRAFFEAVPTLWASIQIAGGFAMAPLTETTLAAWRHMQDMNGTTCFLACREAVRRMRASGGEGGRLVNVAARPALVPTGGMAAYAASKAAVANLTVSLAEELAGEGIWVNAVVPSIMDTPANRKAMPKADHAAWPTVEAVAETLVFLASPTNAVTRGALVPVYGRS